MAKSKWSYLNKDILNLYREDPSLGYSEASRVLLGEDAEYSEVDTLRTYIKRFLDRQESTSETDSYKDKDVVGTDAFKKYCEEEGIDISKVRSAKYVNHGGQQKFNVVLDYSNEDEKVDWDSVKSYIESEVSKWEYEPVTNSGSNRCVVKISDLHLGAYVDGLIRTPDFSPSILKERLARATEIINKKEYDEVYIDIAGDLIESFTGLNHKNSWKNLDKGLHGAEAVKLATKFLAEFISRINNVKGVFIVSGNHDRVTSDSSEDSEGGAANLIAWGLSLIGFEVKYNPLIISHVVDDIAHITTHGHHGISKLSTKELCWEYGFKGMFNYICEGHLHSRMEMLSSKKNFKIVKNDSVDHKRVILPSIFTGNFYSESNSWTSNAGFYIIESNGFGKPNTFDYSL